MGEREERERVEKMEDCGRDWCACASKNSGNTRETNWGQTGDLIDNAWKRIDLEHSFWNMDHFKFQNGTYFSLFSPDLFLSRQLSAGVSCSLFTCCLCSKQRDLASTGFDKQMPIIYHFVFPIIKSKDKKINLIANQAQEQNQYYLADHFRHEK